MPIDILSDANWYPYAIWYQLTPNRIPVDIQSDANQLLIGYKLTSNRMPIDIQSDSNWNQIWFQLRYDWDTIRYFNWVSIRCQLTSNLRFNSMSTASLSPIGCQLDTNWHSIKIQSDANRDPIICQLRSNQMPIKIQSDAIWHSIRCQLLSNLTSNLMQIDF